MSRSAGSRLLSGLDSGRVRNNWFLAALLVGIASIIIAAIAMRLS